MQRMRKASCATVAFRRCVRSVVSSMTCSRRWEPDNAYFAATVDNSQPEGPTPANTKRFVKPFDSAI